MGRSFPSHLFLVFSFFSLLFVSNFSFLQFSLLTTFCLFPRPVDPFQGFLFGQLKLSLFLFLPKFFVLGKFEDFTTMFFPIHLLLVQQLLHLFESVKKFLSFRVSRFVVFRLRIWLHRLILLGFLFIARTCIPRRTAIAFWTLALFILDLFVLLRICVFSVI